jgi:uncharacterized membrane protein YdjX (TVP38/TMEM64 family)
MPSHETLTRIRPAAAVFWLAILATGLYVLFLPARPARCAQLGGACSASVVVAYALYLLLGAIRGCTLLPSTTLVLTALPFFRPWPLLGLTLAGILISSATFISFPSLHLDELMAREHPQKVARVKAALERYEMPIIIGWSCFPLAPTNLIVYVCGAIRVDAKRCLLGVLIGEGATCATYIFGGDALLRALHVRV